MAKRYELPDAAWDLVADLSTESRRSGRPRADDRLMLNGVLWVLCSGAAWQACRSVSAFGQRCINGFATGVIVALSIRCSNAFISD